MREILRSFAAVSSIVGSVARDDVVENPISMEGKLARRNRLRERRTISAIAGRYTPTMKIASPTITASTYTAIALTSDHPNCATAPATSAKIPTGATSSTHRTMRINAWVATSASWVSARRLSSGSAAAATAKMVMKTISGSRLPSTAARSGFAGTRSTMKRAPDGACSAAWRRKLESASAAERSAVCCSAAMGASGSSIEATTKPIRISARLTRLSLSKSRCMLLIHPKAHARSPLMVTYGLKSERGPPASP